MMFCPICKSEYLEGIKRCAECDVDLIDALPLEPVPEFVDYIEVLNTSNASDIALIKSILDGEDIEYFFRGEQFLYVHPLALPATLMVRNDQASEAAELLKDLKLSRMGFNIDESPEELED